MRRSWLFLLVPAFALLACEGAPDGLQAPSARSGAGAGAGGGPSAGQCDATVDDDAGQTIQDAVDAASSDDVICVEPGTYEEEVAIAEDVTVQGRTAPRGGNPVTVDGQIEVTSDGRGAAVRRLRISPSETFVGGTFPDPAGVLVKASDVVVEDNVIEGFRADLSNGQGSFTVHGVQVFGAEGAELSNVTVRDNLIRDLRSEGDPTTWPRYGGVAGVKIQADVDGAMISGNRIVDLHSAGWAWGIVLATSGSAPGVPSAIIAEENHVEGLNDGAVYDVFDGPNDGRNAAPYPGSAFGVDGSADASEATVRYNDFLAPNGAESKDQDATLIAECNWWGDRSGPTHDDNSGGTGTWALERGNASIDYTPWLNDPAPSKACVGGEKGNGGQGG